MRTGFFWLGATKGCPPHAMLMISSQLIYPDKTNRTELQQITFIHHSYASERTIGKSCNLMQVSKNSVLFYPSSFEFLLRAKTCSSDVNVHDSLLSTQAKI
jgi:hypothetical protein